jgi:hypothetical protein
MIFSSKYVQYTVDYKDAEPTMCVCVCVCWISVPQIPLVTSVALLGGPMNLCMRPSGKSSGH